MSIEVIRSLAVKVNNGSGCLFHVGGEYAYVLTARHCIFNLNKSRERLLEFRKELCEVSVWTDNAKSDDLKLNVLDFFISMDYDLDIAVIVVPSSPGVNSIHYKDPQFNQPVIAFGYPKIRYNDDDPTEYLNCTIGLQLANGKGFDIISTSSLTSANNDGHDNTVGLSGSGVFTHNNHAITLAGILTNIKNTEGSHDKLQVIKIGCFNDLLSENEFDGSTLKPLIPAFLTTFDNYLAEVFPFTNESLKDVFQEQAKRLTDKGLTPKSIADFLNEKVFIPHNNGLSINDPLLWQGWIEFLTYISFNEDVQDHMSLPASILRPDAATSKKYFFFQTEGNTWITPIKHLIIKSNKRYKPGTKFYINTKNRPLNPPILPAEEQNRIITDISSPHEIRTACARLQIDQANMHSEYSFVHLQAFLDIFSSPSFSSIRDAETLKELIQQGLKNNSI